MLVYQQKTRELLKAYTMECCWKRRSTSTGVELHPRHKRHALAHISGICYFGSDLTSSPTECRDYSNSNNIPASLSSTCMSGSSALACLLRSQIFVKTLNSKASDSFLSVEKEKASSDSVDVFQLSEPTDRSFKWLAVNTSEVKSFCSDKQLISPQQNVTEWG